MRTLKEVTVEVIQKCYSSCIFCSSQSNPFANNEIPLEKLKEIFHFVKEHGAQNINLSGGEPLLRQDIAEIIDTLIKMGLTATVYTSGNIPDIKNIEVILKKEINTNSIKFIFNYPSFNNEIFQKLINCKEIHVTDVDKYIRILTNKDIPVEAHIVPNAININDLYKTIFHLKKLNIKQVSLLRIVYQGRAQYNKKLLFLGQEHTEKLKKIISDVKKNLCNSSFSLRLGIPFNNLNCQKVECFAGISKLIFRYDGIVFPCEAFKEAPHNENYILGNIYTDSLNSIWENHPIHDRLKLLKQSAFKNLEDCPAQLLYR